MKTIKKLIGCSNDYVNSVSQGVQNFSTSICPRFEFLSFHIIVSNMGIVYHIVHL